MLVKLIWLKDYKTGLIPIQFGSNFVRYGQPKFTHVIVSNTKNIIIT